MFSKLCYAKCQLLQMLIRLIKNNNIFLQAQSILDVIPQPTPQCFFPTFSPTTPNYVCSRKTAKAFRRTFRSAVVESKHLPRERKKNFMKIFQSFKDFVFLCQFLCVFFLHVLSVAGRRRGKNIKRQNNFAVADKKNSTMQIKYSFEIVLIFILNVSLKIFHFEHLALHAHNCS